MHIVVCIKQVPDTTNVRINPETNTLIREGVESIINPFDTYAIEEAVRIKERHGSGKVTVISMGPPQVQTALRDALALGADEAVLLSAREFAGADTWATSYTLAKGIKKLGHTDLIICGKQAIDGDTAQVGPGIAVHLNLPHIAFVKKIEQIDKTKAKMERMMDEGYDVLEISLPAVISVVKEINEPRMPSLKGKMRAKSAEIKILTNKELGLNEKEIGLNGSPTQVVKIFTPPAKEGGEIFHGEAQETVGKLLDRLNFKELV
ncbi:electron transfer flavoprotein subunit beta/FixA family protein [bacterium]|nr:electron transfer flavoprotein subunit beta/FixA family protein [bacterium]